MKSYTYFDAEEFLQRKVNLFDLNLDNKISMITSENFEAVKAKAVKVFGADAEVVSFGRTIPLKKLTFTPEFTVCGSDFIHRKKWSYGDLIEIIKRLRDPDGCPWDRAQTHESIRSNAIEESYELAEAVDMKDAVKMREEAGDVMLQGLFHAVIADDEGDFNDGDLIDALCEKLITRHTHIFGSEKAADPDEALKNWEAAKAVEKGYRSTADKIASVPVTYGALMRAYKIQKIIKKTGFDFADESGAYEKVVEELEEYRNATAAEREKEGGDILFAAVNFLRMGGIDPEVALSGTTARFIKRYLYMEKRCKEEGVELKSENIDKMEEFYQEAKKVVG